MNFDCQLFFGFPLSESYQAQLNQLPIQLRSVFIQNHPDYLREVHYQGISYLGKSLGTCVDFSSLELIQAHIYSMLRRLVSSYSYEETPLVLIPLQE